MTRMHVWRSFVCRCVVNSVNLLPDICHIPLRLSQFFCKEMLAWKLHRGFIEAFYENYPPARLLSRGTVTRQFRDTFWSETVLNSHSVDISNNLDHNMWEIIDLTFIPDKPTDLRRALTTAIVYRRSYLVFFTMNHILAQSFAWKRHVLHGCRKVKHLALSFAIETKHYCSRGLTH